MAFNKLYRPIIPTNDGPLDGDENIDNGIPPFRMMIQILGQYDWNVLPNYFGYMTFHSWKIFDLEKWFKEFQYVFGLFSNYLGHSSNKPTCIHAMPYTPSIMVISILMNYTIILQETGHAPYFVQSLRNIFAKLYYDWRRLWYTNRILSKL